MLRPKSVLVLVLFCTDCVIVNTCYFLQGIFHFQLGRGEPMLHTRLRPHCKEFLEKIAKLYELHVFTFGSRLYAHTIAGNGFYISSLFPYIIGTDYMNPYSSINIKMQQ